MAHWRYLAENVDQVTEYFGFRLRGLRALTPHFFPLTPLIYYADPPAGTTISDDHLIISFLENSISISATIRLHTLTTATMDDLTPEERAIIARHRAQKLAVSSTLDQAKEHEDEDAPGEDDSEEGGNSEEGTRERTPEGLYRLTLPPTDVSYTSKERLCEEVQKFAIQHGYAVVIKRSDNKRERITLRCDRGWVYNTSVKDQYRKRDGHRIRGNGCPFYVKSTRINGDFFVRITNPFHNHQALPTVVMPTARKRALKDIKAQDYVATQSAAGSAPKEIANKLLLNNADLPLKMDDLYNLKSQIRRDALGGNTPIQALVNELNTSDDWYSNIRLGLAGKVTGLFFSHTDSQWLLRRNPEVLIMDCTYKTNRYNLPLFDIVGVDCEQRTFWGGFCFLKGERYEDFLWALTCLQEVYIMHALDPPETLVIGRCTGLMSAITQIFPTTTVLTCFWHHRENLKTNCRREFPLMTNDNPPVETDEEWHAFEAAWFHCLDAPTKHEYDLRWVALIDAYSHTAPESLLYLHNNWQGHWVYKLAKFGTNKTLHLFNTSTSRVEGFHKELKTQLKVATGDLRSVVHGISVLLKRQRAQSTQIHAEGIHNAKRQHLIPEFSLIKDVISSFALDKVLEQKALIKPEIETCTHVWTTTSGLPCKHTLKERFSSNDPRLLPEDFHRHWFYDWEGYLPRPPDSRAFIQDPDVSNRHVKSRRGTFKSSTLRRSTAAEIEENRLAKEVANTRRIARLQQIAQDVPVQQQNTPADDALNESTALRASPNQSTQPEQMPSTQPTQPTQDTPEQSTQPTQPTQSTQPPLPAQEALAPGPSGEPPAKRRRGRPTKAEAAVRAKAEAEKMAEKAAAAAEKARVTAAIAATAATQLSRKRGKKTS